MVIVRSTMSRMSTSTIVLLLSLGAHALPAGEASQGLAPLVPVASLDLHVGAESFDWPAGPAPHVEQHRRSPHRHSHHKSIRRRRANHTSNMSSGMSSLSEIVPPDASSLQVVLLVAAMLILVPTIIGLAVRSRGGSGKPGSATDDDNAAINGLHPQLMGFSRPGSRRGSRETLGSAAATCDQSLTAAAAAAATAQALRVLQRPEGDHQAAEAATAHTEEFVAQLHAANRLVAQERLARIRVLAQTRYASHGPVNAARNLARARGSSLPEASAALPREQREVANRETRAERGAAAADDCKV